MPRSRLHNTHFLRARPWKQRQHYPSGDYDDLWAENGALSRAMEFCRRNRRYYHNNSYREQSDSLCGRSTYSHFIKYAKRRWFAAVLFSKCDRFEPVCGILRTCFLHYHCGIIASNRVWSIGKMPVSVKRLLPQSGNAIFLESFCIWYNSFKHLKQWLAYVRMVVKMFLH